MKFATKNINQELAKANQTSDNGMCDYALIADLFIYPEQDDYKDRIREVNQYFLLNLPESATAMEPFMEALEAFSFKEMQELYLRSFDVQAITTLDIGFILFGEDYKRGQLLVHLNREHREAGNVCHTELSDHLPNVLRLLAKMKDITMRSEIATRLVIPSIVKMIREFSPEKIQKKDEIYKKHLKTILEYSQNYRTVYATLLEALFIALKSDFGYTPAEADTAQVTGCQESFCSGCGSEKDYRQNIETELLIDKGR